jgi:uncharacterized protein
VADLSWHAIVLIGLATAFGAFVQAVVGLGLGLLSAPVVALVAPSMVPDLTLWLALLVAGLVLAAEHQHVDWRAIGWSLPARVPGTVVGAWLVVTFTQTQLGVALAVMVLVAVVLTVRTVEVTPTPTSLAIAGFVAGASGTATSIGGPPIALLFQRERPEVARATMSVFFFVGVILSLVGLGLSGSLEHGPFLLALVLIPGVVVGYVVGLLCRNRIARETFRRGVLVVCTISALAVLARAIL